MAEIVVNYSPLGDSLSLIFSDRPADAELTDHDDARGIFVWRAPSGRLALIELLGWRERSVDEWRAILPPDLPLDDAVLARIEVAVRDGRAEFMASGRYPEYAQAMRQGRL